MQLKKILIVAPHIPIYDTNAGDWRIYTICKALSEKYKVFLLVLNCTWVSERYIDELRKYNVDIIFPGYNSNFNLSFLLKTLNFDIVIFEYYYTAERFIKFFPLFKKIIVDTHELIWIKLKRMYEIENSNFSSSLNWEEVMRRELNVYKLVDTIVVIGEYDKKILRKIFPNKNIVVVPTCVDIVDNIKPDFDRRENIVFFGSFSQTFNVDAAKYLVEEIIPHVRKRLPQVKFHFGGFGSENLNFKKNNCIIIDGYIEDIPQYLSKFKIFVYPLRYGAGAKKKILDAISVKLPVITTHIGKENLKFVDNQEIIVVKSRDEFIDKIITLYCNEEWYNSIVENSYKKLKRYYGMLDFKEKVLSLMDGL